MSGIGPANVDEGASRKGLYVLIHDLGNTNVDELLFQISRQERPEHFDPEIAFQIATPFTASQIVQCSGAADDVPPVLKHIAGDF